MTRLLGRVVILLVTSATLGAARIGQAPEPIWVTATVTDVSGRVVTSLRQEDFRVMTGPEDREVVRDITVFSRDEMPAAISLMIDLSGSMRDQMVHARKAAMLLTTHFRRGDRLNIGVFDSEVFVSDQFTANRARIAWSLGLPQTAATIPCIAPSARRNAPGSRGLPGLPQPGSGTAMWDGVWCGTQELVRDTESIRKVLVVITDGMENSSRSVEATTLTAVHGAGVTVYPVGLLGRQGGLARADGQLRKLADATGGSYFGLEDKDPLEPVFSRISEELRGQYVLGFAARSNSESGALRITAADPALTVRARARYSAR